MDPTVDEANLQGWHATAWCQVTCRRGVPLDLLALKVAGRGSWPFSRVFGALKCDRCGGKPDTLVVARQAVGKFEDVARYER